MKRVKLYAYFANNLGDDLMVHILLKRYPQYRFFSDSWDENSIFLKYSNFFSMGGTQIKYGRMNHLLNLVTFGLQKSRYLEHIRKRESSCDCSVHIGGSLFQQPETDSFDARLKDEEKKLHQSPLYIIGANFGPYRNDEFRIAFADYFRKCGGVTFRDQASYRLFSDNQKVAYAPDVVFNLEIPDERENKNKVLMSVIDLERRENLRKWSEVYDARIAELCGDCIMQGKTPVLMSFCKSEGDENAISRIVHALPEDVRNQTETFFYNGNISEALELFRTADRVVATRFHAMILAMKFGKPVFSISYNQKVKHVLQDVGLDCYCELDDLSQKDGRDILNSCQLADVSDYVKQAEKQFAQFEAYMKEVK